MIETLMPVFKIEVVYIYISIYTMCVFVYEIIIYRYYINQSQVGGSHASNHVLVF